MKYKPFRVVTDTNKNKFIYIIQDGKQLPDSYDNLIALPDSFKTTLDVEPMLKQLKKLGYSVKGDRFLSQKTGNAETEFFIKI